MSEKTDFQLRVLKKYGVIPVFDGQPEHLNVKTFVAGETFNQWCTRVLGKKAAEVRLLSLVDTTPAKGHARIGKLAGNAEYLKKIMRKESRKSYLRGLSKASFEGEDDAKTQEGLLAPRSIGRGELFATMAGAVPDSTPAVNEFFANFSDNHAEESSWAMLFEILARKYAQLIELKRDQLGHD
jgi:hypothetical protein